MRTISTKQLSELRDSFVRNLTLDGVESGEIDAILRNIDSYDLPVHQKILALSLAFSNASSSLVPGLLRQVKSASVYFSFDDFDRWVTAAFDLLDSGGMDQALGFLSRTSQTDLQSFLTKEGLQLSEATTRIEIYLRALSGRELKVLQDKDTYTDTVNLYLPATANRFSEQEDNFFLYKLAAAHCWGQITLGTLTLDIDLTIITDRFAHYPLDHPDLDVFFNLFPERALALDLYLVIESFRIERFLQQELPALMRKSSPIKKVLFEERQHCVFISDKTCLVENLWWYFLGGKKSFPELPNLAEVLHSLKDIGPDRDPGTSIKLLYRLYDLAAALPGEYTPRPAPFFIGGIRPKKIAERMEEQKAGQKKKLEGMIKKLLEMPDFAAGEHAHERAPQPDAPLDPATDYLAIKGKLMELDNELKSVIDERGGIPGGILVKGSEVDGGSAFRLIDPFDETELETREGGVKYDEWDYKRGGYKKGWCSLFERDIQPEYKPFVLRTLKRYSGYVSILRKKFELLKRERQVKRRQKDGDDIDFDALVETYSDIRAGVTPSENVFTRLDRQERNIAVLFLVDMSGSTKGWVNQAEKESLVLMLEALETLGDSCAVYGFSGMTRNRCDLYRIKGFDEPYADTIKRRIAGIETKDYTRMGPFIRHSVKLLKAVEAKTRLLITLSDGKPEDWDGYKGDYSIEDTRKALVEMRAEGIHPFCITIDHEAQSYLPHLFGKANYIFIDDIRKLPSRITEIYRSLTT